MQVLQLEANAPWRQRFHVPQILWARVARAAPTRGVAVTNRSGAYQLYAWDVPTGHLQPLTDRADGVLDGRIAPDGRYVYHLADQAGNEIGHLVRIPFHGGAPVNLTPAMAPYACWGAGLSLAGIRLVFVAANRDGHQVCCMDLGPGETVGPPRVLYQSRHELWSPIVSAAGDLAVLASMERAGKRQPSLIAFDLVTGAKVAELWDGPETSLAPVMFSLQTGDNRLLAMTNRTGVERPLVWNVRTGERRDLPLADLAGDVYPRDWEADGARILVSQIANAVQHLYVYDLGTDSLTPLAHPSGTFGLAYFTAGEILAQWQDATHPPCLIAMEATTGRQTRTVLSAGAVPASCPWRSVTFPSSDGQAIQGWLSLPDGPGPFPIVLEVHGGPQASVLEIFSAKCQAWLDHGFAYCTINYRGSTTFGRVFEEQIWGHPGDWELEDIVAARAWLVEQGIARPDQILLTGRSYGGYLTLLALGKRPNLWAGGMAHIAIGDFTLQYEDASESLKVWNVTMFGGTPEEKPEQYRVSSPITYAEHVRAPVLMIQGRHDTRTPARQAEAYIARMQALGKAIEVYWHEAGHMAASVERFIEDMERMLRFAARVCGRSA